MEWKIGEIRQINSEWYQCVESDSCGECSLFTTECGSGTKSYLADKVFGQCSKVRRSDNKHIVFKKLEKVGVPYHNSEKKLCQQYKCYINPLVTDEIVYVFADNRAVIEIKQNKEDMEEKKLNLKPFDLEAAKLGKPVCTRGGRKARIICFDANIMPENKNILALIRKDDGSEYVEYYTSNGKFSDSKDDINDLMMFPEKKEGWVNLYPCDYMGQKRYSTKEEALKKALSDVIATVKIEWEE